MDKSRLPEVIFASLLCCVASLFADEDNSHVIDLRQGDHLRGSCASVENGSVTWRTAYGDLVRLPLGDILTLNPGEVWDMEFSDGQRIRGTWQIIDGVLIVPSPVFGLLRCTPIELKSAVPALSARGLGADLPPPASPKAEDKPPPVTPPLGNKPPSSSLQTLLRESSVLLRPGEWSVSTAFGYAHSHTLYSPVDTRVAIADLRVQRGITPRLEVAIDWPVLWTNTETTLLGAGTDASSLTFHDRRFRSGNPEVSASALLVAEGAGRPECVAVAGLTIPVNPADEGGLFRTRVGLEFLKTSDPGALFGGFGWSCDWDGWDSAATKPMNHFNYHFGAAVGLNDELALGFQMQAQYDAAPEDRTGRMLAASQEPVSGKFWINLRFSHNRFVEMSVTAPMNDDAHTTTFGLTYISRY